MAPTLLPPGETETRGDRHILRFAVPLPHPGERVWLALTTPGGLGDWLAESRGLQPRLGGEVALRWLTPPDRTAAPGPAESGTVTAWELKRIAEYTVGPHGRMRFQLEPGERPGTTVLRFTNEFRGTEEQRLDRLACWHDHFLHLAAHLDGHRTDWADWSTKRWQGLRDDYEARDFDAS
ncbi:SRPBCC domain-containing protein [Streptomyces sp. NPDC046887]|uniref:SRPBCC domain-containing protein n=1 Tax=Streptomyces sp. NPDC046887 TaxID=3155472 RepID=UPI0033CA33E2